MPPPILGSEGVRGVVTYYNAPSYATVLEVHTWLMTGAYEAAAVLTWTLYIDDEYWTDSVTMATNLATVGAALAASINALLPPDTVVATFASSTLTLTSETLGLRFTEEFSSTGPDLPVWPTTANLGGVNSNHQNIVPTQVSSTGRASQQPARGRDLQVLPEGERQGDYEIFLTYDTVYTSDQDTGRPATQIVNYEGERFKVVQVWETRAVIPHFCVLAVRLPESLPAPTTPVPGENLGA